MKRILKGLIENQAETDATSADNHLQGRTYAIPFDKVWQAAIQVARGGLRGWSLVSADDQEGVIETSTRTSILGLQGRARVEIRLDENAQTRVDVASASHAQLGDLGRNRRAIGRFFRILDQHLEAEPRQILDTTRTPAWLDPS